MPGDKDDVPRITGTKDVLLKLRFAVPPGQDPVAAAAQLPGAVNLPLTLIPFLKSADAEIVDVVDGPKLHRPN